jgi:hypothetical protein
MSQSNNPPQDDDSAEDSPAFTSNTGVRIRWLGSLLATFTIIAFFGLVYGAAFGYATFDPITASVFSVLALLVLAAGTWAFGIDLIDKYTGK